MTSPVTRGYPDYSGFLLRANRLLNTETGTVLNASTTRGRFFVGDSPYHGIRFVADTNHFEATCSFYDQQTGGTELTAQTYSIRQGSTLDLNAPVGGPWLQVDVEPAPTPATFDMTLWTASSPGRFARADWSDCILFHREAQLVNAGATLTIDSTRIWPGSVVWSIATGIATWAASLRHLDWAGTNYLLDSMDNTGGIRQQRQMLIGPANLRLVFQNTSGANGTMNVSVIARAIEPGW